MFFVRYPICLAQLFGQGFANASFHHVLHGGEGKAKAGAELHLLGCQANAAIHAGALEMQLIALPLAGKAVFLGQLGRDLVNGAACLVQVKRGWVDDMDIAHALRRPRCTESGIVVPAGNQFGARYAKISRVNIPRLPRLILRFPAHQHSDLPLQPGMSRLCRDPDFDRGLMLAREGSRSLIDFCLDERGLWLHVAEGVAGVHVNGRPVRSLALLRAGDSIHCEGVEMYVGEAAGRAANTLPELDEFDTPEKLPFPVLRGLCGADHGRTVLIDRPLKIGGKDADIVLEGQQDMLAQIDCRQGQLWLQAVKTGQAVQLNGESVELAQLQHGDQLLFAPCSRYLLEVPGQSAAVLAAAQKPAAALQQVAEDTAAPRRWQVPWLLLAAILSAAFLAALLWFGVK